MISEILFFFGTLTYNAPKTRQELQMESWSKTKQKANNRQYAIKRIFIHKIGNISNLLDYVLD